VSNVVCLAKPGRRGALQAMRDVVAKCLVKDPSKRPTAAQLLEHKFFKARRTGAPWGLCFVLKGGGAPELQSCVWLSNRNQCPILHAK
jgi:serine/threonine protein kinase